VIELQSGTGIGAIALKKFGNAGMVVAMDRNQEVTGNISKNC
jgi:precorrin-6B methylase 2